MRAWCRMKSNHSIHIFGSSRLGRAVSSESLCRIYTNHNIDRKEELAVSKGTPIYEKYTCSSFHYSLVNELRNEELAQSKLTSFGRVKKYVEKLEDFMALLAYEEPEKSPMFHLLSSEYQQHVVESLNGAILAHSNMPSYSALERLLQQTTVVRHSLHQESNKNEHAPFSLKDFLKS